MEIEMREEGKKDGQRLRHGDRDNKFCSGIPKNENNRFVVLRSFVSLARQRLQFYQKRSCCIRDRNNWTPRAPHNTLNIFKIIFLETGFDSIGAAWER